MPSETIPTQDTNFNLFVKSFADVVSANAAELPVTPDQVTAIQNLAAGFNSVLNESEQAKNQLRSKIAEKDELRTQTEKLIRVLGKHILSDPQVSNSLKSNLGLCVQPRPPKPISEPADLSAFGDSNGMIKLNWERNQNTFATMFCIEVRVGTSKEWKLMDMTSKTKYVDRTQTPGVQVVYRIYAQRAGKRSRVSNEAVVYSGMGFQADTLRAA